MAGDVLSGGVAMGVSFEGVKMDANAVLERWMKVTRALKEADQV